jgi:lysophospholipid acyltransferase (LPLAT)-like uncharacterized protein
MVNPWPEIRFYLIGLVGSWLMGICGWSLRMDVRLLGNVSDSRRLRGSAFLLCCWRDTLFATILVFGGANPVALVSRSEDGELTAPICRQRGWSVVRGSSTRGGADALRELLRCARRSTTFRAGFALDGPRGPRRESKAGAVFLASRLGVPLLPVGVYMDKAWRFRSWDGLGIPKPFSRVWLTANRLIDVPGGLNASQVEHYRQILEEAMGQAEREAERLVP